MRWKRTRQTDRLQIGFFYSRCGIGFDLGVEDSGLVLDTRDLATSLVSHVLLNVTG